MIKVFSKFRHMCLIGGLALLMQGCGLFGGGNYDDKGNLVGVPNREGWEAKTPFGMVEIPAGTFHMGQADEDVAFTQSNFNKQVTINQFYMDDSEITNNEYRQYIHVLLEDSVSDLGEELIYERYYPDTASWNTDFSHHLGDPMVAYYFSHPGYDDYPVVGVSWEAAKHFAKWRSNHMNQYREAQGEFRMPDFRLPSEAEWEYAARGGRDMAMYPWGGPYTRNAAGCLSANFKSGRGNYYDDGFSYTAPVYTFLPNEFGIYDMAGNVAEWCEDAYNPAAVPLVWDLNPKFFDDDQPKKVVRGGSWKDVAYYLQTGTRTFEFKDSTRSYIGFRCVMDYLGSPY
ncbi:MAG: SUMF1/EgtB/PvdO family nonheme iron enzyme [Cytophagales bacterium]|nr:SUMF1/EgtB/PvdO family nonheme iron enzyme [Cytophagales bacterium]